MSSATSVRSLAKLAPPSAIAAAVFAMVAIPYMKLFERYQYTGESASIDLSAFFLPPPGSLLHFWSDEPRLVSHFLGYVTLLLGILGCYFVFRDRGETTRAVWLGFAVLGVACFAFAGGPDLLIAGHRFGDGPFRVLQLLGPFAKLRAPDRMVVLVYLVLALFAARGIVSIEKRFGRKRLLALIIGGMIMAEQWSAVRTQGLEIPTGRNVPEAYRWLTERASVPKPVAELPVWPFGRIRFTSIEAYFSTLHGHSIPFGKPSFYPPALELLQWELRGFPDRRSIYLLQGLDFELALVHPKRWTNRRKANMRRLERRSDVLRPLAEFDDRDNALWNRYALGGERIYAIDGEPMDLSPRECNCVEIDRSDWRLNARGAGSPELAVDGNRLTKWTTSGGQKKGDYFEITFRKSRRPVRVEIEMSFPWGEFPRHLEMNGYRGTRGHRVTQVEDLAHKLKLIEQLIDDPTKARLRYDFEPMTVDRLRLFINRTEDAVIDWSIAEIHVYESTDDPVAPAPQ
jgi:hypothetical protein